MNKIIILLSIVVSSHSLLPPTVIESTNILPAKVQSYNSQNLNHLNYQNAFISSPSLLTSIRQESSTEMMMSSDKQDFLDSLDRKDSLNQATKERSALMQKMIDNKLDIPANNWNEEKFTQSSVSASLERPGLRESFNTVAEGNWKVIYAPHMTTIAGLFGGKFDVQYTLHPSEKMESHARYDFPVVGEGFLSVSGTYGSVDENVSRVDFDKAWIKPLSQEKDEDKPYQSLDDVPNGLLKDTINAIGQTFFIDQVSVFPISFLDDDLIIFDFRLLGTRICAMKQ